MSPNKTPKQRVTEYGLTADYRKESSKLAHTSFGLILYLSLIASCLLGYAKHINYSVVDGKLLMLAGCAFVSLYLLVAFSVSKSPSVVASKDKKN